MDVRVEAVEQGCGERGSPGAGQRKRLLEDVYSLPVHGSIVQGSVTCETNAKPAENALKRAYRHMYKAKRKRRERKRGSTVPLTECNHTGVLRRARGAIRNSLR